MSNHMIAALALLLAGGTAHAGTLDKVMDRGTLRCGVSQGVAGFSAPDDAGNWTGFDVDFCKAVAAAALGDGNKVTYVPLSTTERFTALQSGDIDLLSRQTTWTLSRDADLGLSFVGVAYYDGQAFMVNRSVGVKSATELDGASVCTETGTTTELNMADYFTANGVSYNPVSFEKADQTITAFSSGRCDVYTTDASALYAQRLSLVDPDNYIILPEVISKEPLGPAVRQGDEQWFKIARWTLNALIEAEELGISMENAEDLAANGTAAQKRLLAAEADSSGGLGLDPQWARRAIAAVGNYGEVFERNLGAGSPLKIDRGLNRLWNDGGLLYAPPVR